MKKLLLTIFILALVLCFVLPAFAIKILPYNVPLQDLMRWDKYGVRLRLSNPEGETLTVAWPTTVDLWNYDGKTWTYDLPSGDTFAFGKGLGITGDLDIAGRLTVTDTLYAYTDSTLFDLDVSFDDVGNYHTAAFDVIVTSTSSVSGDWDVNGRLYGQRIVVNLDHQVTNTFGLKAEVITTGTTRINDVVGVMGALEIDGTHTKGQATSSFAALRGDINNTSDGSWDAQVYTLFLNYGSGKDYGLETAWIHAYNHADSYLDFGIHLCQNSLVQPLEVGIWLDIAASTTVDVGIDLDNGGTLTTGIDIGNAGIGINFTGAYDSAEIVGTTFVLDATTSISLQAGAGTFDFVAAGLQMNALTITEAGNITADDAKGFALLDEATSASNPTLIPDRRDFTTGFGVDSSEVITVVLGGVEEYSFDTADFDINANTISEAGTITSDEATGFAVLDEAAAVDNPTLIPNRADLTTGIGWDSSEIVTIVLGGTEEYNFDADDFDMNANTISEVGDILANDAQGFALISEPASLTNPTLVPDRRDESTGIGYDSPEVVVVVLGGVEEYSFDTADFDMNDNTFSEVGLMTSSGGIVLEDGITVAYGDDSDVTVEFDTGKTALVTAPLGNFVSPEGMSDRFRLEWVAGQRGKPGVSADVVDSPAFATTDPDFEILGTNANSEDVTFYAEGGIVLETDGADSDEVILLPHLTANQSAWEQVTWGTDNEVRWECYIRTGDSIETSIIWAGLKLTNTEIMTTDDDQLFFRYEDGVNSGKWQAITTIHGGADDAHDTNVAVAASADYHLVIEIEDTGIATFYINGEEITTGDTFAGEHADLIPYIGIAEDGAGDARSLIIRGQVISREY